ncbi:recombinase family protein [Glutamicibacter sp. PS]|uniref:recombinase family protein n=1 Tax=Glutamicibacter sp. PS TaxID=3075634 RepID=UPI00284DF361|nr:recombinase family protein [Glutamicibacter sp. PS]MDR4533246.1 recombinase family protein [Glutamicibacter sp. PS]
MNAKKTTPVRPRAVLYLRQSIAREDSISLELQEDAGRRYCEQSGYQVVAVEADPGISGRTWNRPAVQRVMGMIENGDAEVIVLWKWSRLSRARLDWAVAIDKVESAGGRIESATESVDVSTSTGRFARGMLAEFAAFESERIGDTWREAHRRRVESGRPASGRKRFGYNYNRSTGFTPHPIEGPIVQESYRRYLLGDSFQTIAAWLNSTDVRPSPGYGPTKSGLWSDRAIKRVLDNPFASGKFTHKGELYQGIHEPLITEEQWEEYLVRRKARYVHRRGEKTQYLLTGYICCGQCGYGMYAGLFGHDRTLKYRCSGAANFRIHPGGYVTEKVIMAALRSWLGELVEELNAQAASATVKMPVLPDRTAALNRQLIKNSARLDNLTTRFIDELIPADVYQRMRDELLSEKSRLENDLMEARVISRKPAVELAPDLMDHWDQMPLTVRREILSRVVGKIVVTSKRPQSEVRIVAKWEDKPKSEPSSN